ncbi:MAG: hypothetical protein VKP57_08005 [Candidatus Sericytochromatia bacterium]|nr:hypothetical protein [Candidatus Sericytochromatia bacterium]
MLNREDVEIRGESALSVKNAIDVGLSPDFEIAGQAASLDRILLPLQTIRVEEADSDAFNRGAADVGAKLLKDGMQLFGGGFQTIVVAGRNIHDLHAVLVQAMLVAAHGLGKHRENGQFAARLVVGEAEQLIPAPLVPSRVQRQLSDVPLSGFEQLVPQGVGGSECSVQGFGCFVRGVMPCGIRMGMVMVFHRYRSWVASTHRGLAMGNGYGFKWTGFMA